MPCVKLLSAIASGRGMTLVWLTPDRRMLPYGSSPIYKAWALGRPFCYISELRRNEQLEVYFLGGRSDLPLNIKGRYRNGTYDNIHTSHCVVDGCRWRAFTGAVSDAGDERYSLGDGQLRKNLFRRHVPSCVAGQRRQHPFKFLAQIVT
jgi:hypothetical protein